VRLSGNEEAAGNWYGDGGAPFTATVKLNTTSAMPAQAKVVVISPDFGSIRTRVAFAKSRPHVASIQLATRNPS